MYSTYSKALRLCCSFRHQAQNRSKLWKYTISLEAKGAATEPARLFEVPKEMACGEDTVPTMALSGDSQTALARLFLVHYWSLVLTKE